MNTQSNKFLPLLFAQGTQSAALRIVLAIVTFGAGIALIVRETPASAAHLSPDAETKHLRIGVIDGPEREVLDFVRKENGHLHLELVPYPNENSIRRALHNREVDAASFESGVSLTTATNNPGAERTSAGLTLTLPLAFYSKTRKRLDDIELPVRVVISTDPEAEGRALLLLHHLGFIEKGADFGPAARLRDIPQDPQKLLITQRPTSELRSALDQADLVALEYQDAKALGLAPARNSLAMEDGFTPFSQVLSIQTQEKARLEPHLEELWRAYRSPSVKKFIRVNFEDSVRRPW